MRHTIGGFSPKAPPPKPLPFPMGGVEFVSRKPDTSANIHRTSVANRQSVSRTQELPPKVRRSACGQVFIVVVLQKPAIDKSY